MTIEEVESRLEEEISQTEKNFAEMKKKVELGDPSEVIALKNSILRSLCEIEDLTATKFGLLLQERASKLADTSAVA